MELDQKQKDLVQELESKGVSNTILNDEKSDTLLSLISNLDSFELTDNQKNLIKEKGKAITYAGNFTSEQNELVKKYFYLVEKAAAKYPVVYDEAYSIAQEQLLKAIQNYDPNKGTSIPTLFYTYFGPEITKYYQRQHIKNMGRFYYDEGVLKDKIKKLEDTLNKTIDPNQQKFLEEEIINLKKQLEQMESTTNVSLSTPVKNNKNEREDTIEEYIEDLNVLSTLDQVDYQHLKDSIESKLKTDISKAIFHFLLQGYTATEIAQVMNPKAFPELTYDEEEDRYYNTRTKSYIPKADIPIPLNNFGYAWQINKIINKEILPLIQDNIYDYK